MRVDESEEGATSSEKKSEKTQNVPFLLTKVRNIPARFNASTVAVGLRGNFDD